MQDSRSLTGGDRSSARDLPALVRGTICHMIGNPFVAQEDSEVLQCFEDGGLAVGASGQVLSIGSFKDVATAYPAATVTDRRGCLILPGLVDGHIHYPQALMVGSYGEQLLSWLEKYTFPEEERYRDESYAQAAARIFFAEEIAQGTTTALVFGSHFEKATAISFQEASRRRFRALMGMTLSDRNIRESLKMGHDQAYEACKRLIMDWHGHGKLRYVVTPRYAPTCSDSMFAVCVRLLQEHPDMLVQTHISENLNEVAWIRELYPQESSYLDVYERRGLVGSRTVFSHAIHSTDKEIARMAEAQCSVVHCPSSNSFMGSGLMPLGKFVESGVKVALGTDIGGGTGYSLFQEMNQAYKVQMLQLYALGDSNHALKLSGAKLLYLATLGGARALGLEGEIGNLMPGKCADFLVIDPELDGFVKARLKNIDSLNEELFVLATIGSKQLIREVYIDGTLAHAAVKG